MTQVSKLEAAQRQLDTAIDLFFDNADSLSVHTLAFASFRVLLDMYPHYKDDGFDAQLDRLIRKEGWAKFSKVANFLKHADRDARALLEAHHPAQAEGIIGIATLLYRRLNGEFSLKMEAFDCWIEGIAAEALEIEEVDENEERVQHHRNVWNTIANMPHDKQIVLAKRHYEYYLSNASALKECIAKAEREGISLTEILDGNATTSLLVRVLWI